MTTEHARIGVVLGAGGVLGHAFHAGVLAALHEVTGFDAKDADRLVGTSAGSVVAALLAGGMPAADLAAEALGRPVSDVGRRLAGRRGNGAIVPPEPDPSASRWRPAAPALLARLVTRPWRHRPGVLAAAALPAGRTAVPGLGSWIGGIVGATWPDRLRVVAVRLGDGRRVVFGDPDAPATDAVHAVSASCAIPAYYAPVEIAGERYLDGGVHSPTNADVLGDERLDLVVVVSPMSVAPSDRRVTADLPARLYFAALLARERRRLEKAGTAVLVFAPDADDRDAMGISPMAASRREDVTRQAHASTLRRLDVLAGDPRLAVLAERGGGIRSGAG
ncbi:MAG: patatin-like phospholipase family protein [Actinobacteria bacterium]|nr:patatin-like phospholipase family protein [Actinomycetota bacterium]